MDVEELDSAYSSTDGDICNIKAVVRIRPQLSENNFANGEEGPNVTIKNKGTLVLKHRGVERKFNFDHVFSDSATQEEIYYSVVRPYINETLKGYNCTILCYGQTGTGKTYTISGKLNQSSAKEYHESPDTGIVFRLAGELFQRLRALNFQKIEYTVMLSYVEIYNEEVRDLLGNQSTILKLYGDGKSGNTCIKNCKEITVCTVKDVYELINNSQERRHISSTKLNRDSSRSHTIITLGVYMKKQSNDSDPIFQCSKLNVVDLAGSENIAKSGVTDIRAREAATINRSLFTLGKVIKSLAIGAPHIPYRESKLTRILQSSLGGNSRTTIIATISMDPSVYDVTISTLDYAAMSQKVVNRPIINIELSGNQLLDSLKARIEKLERELETNRQGLGVYISQDEYNEMQGGLNKAQEEIAEKRRRHSEIMETLDMLMAERDRYLSLQESIKETNRFVEKLQTDNERVKKISAEREYKFKILHQKYKSQIESAMRNEDIVDKFVERSMDNFAKVKEKAQAMDSHYLVFTSGMKSVLDDFMKETVNGDSIDSMSQMFNRSIAEPAASIFGEVDGIMKYATDTDEYLINLRQDLRSYVQKQQEEMSKLVAVINDTNARFNKTLDDLDSFIKQRENCNLINNFKTKLADLNINATNFMKSFQHLNEKMQQLNRFNIKTKDRIIELYTSLMVEINEIIKNHDDMRIERAYEVTQSIRGAVESAMGDEMESYDNRIEKLYWDSLIDDLENVNKEIVNFRKELYFRKSIGDTPERPATPRTPKTPKIKNETGLEMTPQTSKSP